VTVSAALVKQALGQIVDLTVALQAKLLDVPDDEQLADDALSDFALADPELAPAVGLVETFVIPGVAWVVENNQSTQPGAVMPPNAGGTAGRGSDEN
jgi:hypothetical protein